MNINLSISAAPSIISNYIVVAIYEATSPNTPADFQAFAAPHTASRNIVFTNVSDVNHIVITYENTTDAVGGTVRHKFDYEPSFTNAEIRADLFLTGGIELDAGGDTYVDASFEGWDYSIELRQSWGTLQPGNEWNKLPAPNFGFQQYIKKFDAGEVWVVHFQPKITIRTTSTQNQNAKLFDSVVKITADTTLTAADGGKMIYVQGDSLVVNIQLPDLSTVLANKMYYITSQGGNHVSAIFKPFPGQVIDFLEGDQSEIIFGQCESAWLYKWVDPTDTNNYRWGVMNAFGNFTTVGEFVSEYRYHASTSKYAKNTIFCNGALLSRTVYKRLWNEVLKTEAPQIVSDADWNRVDVDNKGKFSRGNELDTFRVPLLYLHGYLRAVDGGARKAGDFKPESVGPHTHPLPIAEDATDLGFGVKNITPRALEDCTNRRIYGVIHISDKNEGTETSPANTGVYLSIRY